ncbi:hypothetical protein Sste5344_003901 [Sporothrix stenoceras]
MTPAPASETCFLSSLPGKSVGQKVRFLGCVTDYDPIAGVLTLQHQYQPAAASTSTSASTTPSGAIAPSLAGSVHARVNVDLVLERLTAEQMTVGAWVNVMGYVTEAPEAAAAAIAGVANNRRRRAVPPTSANIQAILLWSTGPLDVQAYERQLSEMLSLKAGT